jgi:hypothetical protein
VFNYGDSATGKTYTMYGVEGSEEGLIGRAVQFLLTTEGALIEMSLIEVINNEVRDLLVGESPVKIAIKLDAHTMIPSNAVFAKLASVHDFREMRKACFKRLTSYQMN